MSVKLNGFSNESTDCGYFFIDSKNIIRRNLNLVTKYTYLYIIIYYTYVQGRLILSYFIPQTTNLYSAVPTSVFTYTVIR